MEPHFHGRRGKELVLGISRAHQTLCLMLAMVATMVCVLLWEASPFVGTWVVHSPVLKTVRRSELEEQATLYEPRPFLKHHPFGRTSSEDTQAVLDLAKHSSNETLVESEEPAIPLAEMERASHDIDDLTSTSTMNLSPALEEEDAVAQEKEVVESKSNSSGMCDYSVGKWVLDEKRPLYSGLECSLWLSPGFSCRLHNHPDVLLDRYRWQPMGCDLPAFDASAALELLRNKVVAFVGDSLGRQQLQSLLCMLTRGKNDTAITDAGSEFGFFTPPGHRKPNGIAYRFEATNTTFIFKWTVTLAYVQPVNISDPLGRNALHLDRPERFLEDSLPKLDVVVLNSGHHWNGGKMKMNRYDFHLDGMPVNKSSGLSRVPVAYNATVHNIVRWMSEAIEGTNKVVYYRSLSPRHFRNGDWNTGGTCDTIRFQAGKQVQEGNRVDPNAESAIVGTNVNLLNITSLSLDRGETHISKYGGGVGGQDCLHWCLPGIPDTWNEILFAELATKFKRRSSSTLE